MKYPMHVTDPGWQRPPDPQDSINLDDIQYDREYRSLDDIKMKDPNKSSPNKRPVVNRANKPGYQPSQTSDIQAADIVRATEELLQTDHSNLVMCVRINEDLADLLFKIEGDHSLSLDNRQKLYQQIQKHQYKLIEMNDVHIVTANEYKKNYENLQALLAGRSQWRDVLQRLEQHLNELAMMESEFMSRFEGLQIRVGEIQSREQQIQEEQTRRHQQALEAERARRERQLAAEAAAIERARQAREEQDRLVC